MNPIKANIVTELEDYPWSSYHHNALGKEDKLIIAHTLYKNLAKTAEQQTTAYKALFESLNLSTQNTDITQATQKGEVGFHTKMAAILSRPTKLTSHGGDRKSEV